MAGDAQLSAFRRFYRIFRWCLLLALVALIVLALKRPGDVPEGPDPVSASEQARDVESKLQQLEEANSRGDAGVQVELSAGEVNAFLSQSIARGNKGTASQAPSAPSTGSASPPPQASTPSLSTTSDSASTPNTVKDFRMAMEGDGITGFFIVDFHGKDLDITVSGRPGASNGYMTFTPTAFKVGSLPIPVSLVAPALQRRLDDPQMHEKLKLPEFVGDLRVQNGQMVITGK